MKLVMNAFYLAGLMFLCALPTFARSPIGGYMSQCYSGNFRTNEVCVTSEKSVEARLNDHVVRITAKVSASYLDESGERVLVKVKTFVEDFSNYFNPESGLPVILRLLSTSGRSERRAYSVISRSIVLGRNPGQRSFSEQEYVFEMKNSWGSESTETLEKIEVLIPGFGNLNVIQF